MNKLRYSLIYWLYRLRRHSRPRWDTGITPPEVQATLPQLKSGRAIDLGCGTGTNAIYLAKLGWQVRGVDFVGQAISNARRKAQTAGVADQVTFLKADISKLDPGQVGGIASAQLALDIGCFHGLDLSGRDHYRQLVSAVLQGNGLFMLYAAFPGQNRGREFGISVDECTAFFAKEFTLEKVEDDGKSAWYWFRRLG